MTYVNSRYVEQRTLIGDLLTTSWLSGERRGGTDRRRPGISAFAFERRKTDRRGMHQVMGEMLDEAV